VGIHKFLLPQRSKPQASGSKTLTCKILAFSGKTLWAHPWLPAVFQGCSGHCRKVWSRYPDSACRCSSGGVLCDRKSGWVSPDQRRRCRRLQECGWEV